MSHFHQLHHIYYPMDNVHQRLFSHWLLRPPLNSIAVSNLQTGSSSRDTVQAGTFLLLNATSHFMPPALILDWIKVMLTIRVPVLLTDFSCLTQGPDWPTLIQKRPDWPAWCKNVMRLTQGPDWPLRCLDIGWADKYCICQLNQYIFQYRDSNSVYPPPALQLSSPRHTSSPELSEGVLHAHLGPIFNLTNYLLYLWGLG